MVVGGRFGYNQAGFSQAHSTNDLSHTVEEAHGMKRVLLADDSVAARKSIQTMLEVAGMEVVTVGNGDLALAKLDVVRPDVVLVDVLMPGRNGYEICADIRRHPTFNAVPVLLLSSDFEPFDPHEAERVGATAHLVKPLDTRAVTSISRAIGLATEPSQDYAGDSPRTTLEMEVPRMDGTSLDNLESYQTVAMPVPDFDAPTVPAPQADTGVVAVDLPIPMPAAFNAAEAFEGGGAIPDAAIDSGPRVMPPPRRVKTTESLEDEVPIGAEAMVREASVEGIRKIGTEGLVVARGVCPACGELLTLGDVFCIACGAVLIGAGPAAPPSQSCGECGLELIPGEIICVGCGAVI
jgi:CheY-like chemotaxis protein